MPRQKTTGGRTEIPMDFGEANPKQMEFFMSRTLFTAYGGAKGGGKTWAVRTLAIMTAIANPGIQIMIMRAHYPELEANHIRPMQRMIPPEIASYNGASHLMTFYNGSIIKFGHWVGDQSEQEYQGQEYDRLFIDEATQFSERAFQYLCGCVRGATPFAKRIYLTCNPGGVGHRYVKRLFIDRRYKTNSKNPEENEDPKNYTFIPATVEDNKPLLESSPLYLHQLANMPEDLRRAYRYGDWDAIGGNYFSEFSAATHVTAPFKIPAHWPRYRSMDYGLDMTAVCWWAIDEDGRCWCYREYEHSKLIVKDAAAEILSHTLPDEKIELTYAPTDIWSTQKDTGRTMADLFAENGVLLQKSDRNRVQGHMVMKNMMAPIPLKDPYVRSLFSDERRPEKLPGLMFFNNVGKLTSDIRDIQADEANPNDCAKDPHEITHTVDAARYFCIMRSLEAEAAKTKAADKHFDDELSETDYNDYMFGGEIKDSYLEY